MMFSLNLMNDQYQNYNLARLVGTNRWDSRIDNILGGHLEPTPILPLQPPAAGLGQGNICFSNGHKVDLSRTMPSQPLTLPSGAPTNNTSLTPCDISSGSVCVYEENTPGPLAGLPRLETFYQQDENRTSNAHTRKFEPSQRDANYISGYNNNTEKFSFSERYTPGPQIFDHSSTGYVPVYTTHQVGRWQQRFDELAEFKKEYGHCCVPSYWPENNALAQWVKRQRSQWKLKKEGKHSSMTDEREQILNALCFVWDSHTVSWEDRLNELKEFVRIHGHANVPTRHPENPQLAVWCKCQRRQFKLYMHKDKRSNMTPERLAKLVDVGFVFNPRTAKPQKEIMLSVGATAA